MSNEELFDTSSEVLDSIPDSSSDPEDNSLSSVNDEGSAAFPTDSEQGSDESAVIPVDTSSVVAVIVDQREVVEELQRIEGYNISILYTLYIGLGLFFSVVIIKFILHFTRFN